MTAKTRLAAALNQVVREQDISGDIQALDEVIAQIARQRGTLEERIRRLMTIPGIGRLTATTMLIDIPELGYLESKKITALAGLAPITQQSGNPSARSSEKPSNGSIGITQSGCTVPSAMSRRKKQRRSSMRM